ncbi:MAG: hydrogenase nickel incorporation protein HypB [Acidobacteriota bacterium]
MAVKIINIFTDVLEENEKIAASNREIFEKNNVFAVNLMSAPGAGKTSLIEKTIDFLKNSIKIAVLEGDITSSIDSERLEKYHIPVIQINTGGECHLNAYMVSEALPHFKFNDIDLLIIENVGNLVCPAEFKVGEDMKVMILSVPEGHDKPKKYPLMFRESRVLIINKIDLKDFCDTDLEVLKKNALEINPSLEIFEVSCKTGAGIEEWSNFLVRKIKS